MNGNDRQAEPVPLVLKLKIGDLSTVYMYL